LTLNLNSTMRQSQAEIKAIEAELRSIRADSQISLLEPGCSSGQLNQQPIAPTINRQALSDRQANSNSGDSRSQTESTRPKPVKSIRSVECFPLPNSYELEQTEWQAASTIMTARNRSTKRSNSVARRTARHNAQTTQLNQSRYLLAEKASQINALANQQEAIILEWITLSGQLEPELESVCEYDVAEIPYVETDDAGTLLLTSRALDLSWLDQSSRRHRRGLTQAVFSLGSGLISGLIGGLASGLIGLTSLIWHGTWALLKLVGAVGRMLTLPLKWLLGQPSRQVVSQAAGQTSQSVSQPGQRNYRSSGRRFAKPFTLTEAAILVIGSALLRFGLDWLVAIYPVLWIPSLLIMLTPAAIAVYRATTIPKTGFAWGYRLFAIMIGLLLGGRL
jgi:hypothetical protein